MMSTAPIDLQFDDGGYIINCTSYISEAIECLKNGTSAPFVKLCGVECNGAPVSELLHSIEHKEAFDNYWFILDLFNIEDIFAATALIFNIVGTVNECGMEYSKDALDGLIAAHNLHVYQQAL